MTLVPLVWLLVSMSTSAEPALPLDSELAPYPYVTTAHEMSRGATSYFRMLPAEDGRAAWEHVGHGRAYRVGAEQDELLWEVEGWYAFSTQLSRDGRHLVRLGNWPRGQEPSHEHLAVAFYADGELLAEYSTRDLIQDDSFVMPSVSHYGYLSGSHGEPGFVSLEGEGTWRTSGFELVTVDRLRYVFDRRTGEIVSRDPLDEPLDPDANKQLVRRYYEHVYSTGAVDELEQYVAPDYVEVHRGERYELGLAGAREHVLGVRRVYPDLALTVEQQLAEGEWVVTRLTMRGTHAGEWQGIPPTGEPVEVSAVNIDRVRAGRIVEHGGAANLLGPLLEAGALQPAEVP